MSRRSLCELVFLSVVSVWSSAQVAAPPVAQRLQVHSEVLNEDRVVWVRMPAAAQGKVERYPVLYMTDASSAMNEIGATIDFLADNNFMPPLIVVAIENTDRVRDLTPSNADVKDTDGSVEHYPTSGGANKFMDFIGTELVPEVDKRYPTQPYRIITGHSLGGLFAIHALLNRPQLFHSCIATSPSTWWDDFFVVREAEQFFTKKREFNKTLFFALGDEGGPMGQGFERLKKIFETAPPNGFVVKSEHYMDELHRTTELRGHYAGLRTIFSGWAVPMDPKTGVPAGGLAGVTEHYRGLSKRFGYPVPAEKAINSLGYRLLGQKKYDDAIAAFNRNVEWYPQSANVYDSLADGLEGAGKLDEALRSVQKAIELGTKNGDPELPSFKKHLDKLVAAKSAAAKVN